MAVGVERFERVVALVGARGGAAQLHVVHNGGPVVDRSFGCDPAALFWIFSASKPFVAMLVHQLAARGELALDDRVAAYWPEFGRRGKDGITVRHVLQHRSGVPVARGAVVDALTMTDWDRSVRALERARPSWPPGQVPAYHYISYGFILGELVRRVTGEPVPEVLAREFLRPLGMRDTFLGSPPPARCVPVHGRGLSPRLQQLVVNRPATRRAVIPAAGVSTTARDLAVFYGALLRDERGVFAPGAVAEARRPSFDGQLDRFLKLPIRWSQGFQLGGAATPAPSMGRTAGPTTFGHSGSNVCIGWADPEHDLVVAYLTDGLPRRRGDSRHQSEVSDAVRDAVVAHPRC